MDRAYFLLETKAIDDDLRIIEGLATSPTTDHIGDIVEPLGAKFKLPMPLLYQHDKLKPIGHVIAAEPTPAGIRITAQIAKGVLPWIDDAWALIKAGLVRGLSVGFKPVAGGADRLKTGGIRYKSWNWHETSAVTIGANEDATIDRIKSIDEPYQRAASGATGIEPTPGVSGNQPLKLNPRGSNVKTIAEQIKDLENTRAAKAARMEDVMKASVTEGRASEDSEGEEFDTLEKDVGRLDADLVRLRKLEAISVAKATPIIVKDVQSGVDIRGGILSVKAPELPPGIEFARYVICKAAAAANGNGDAYQIAKAQYPDQQRILNVLEFSKSMGISNMEMVMKAAVAGGTTVGTTWASPLVQYQQFAGAFLDFLRPKTIIGKFGQNGIPDVQHVPFNVTIGAETSGGDAWWVGEGAPKPLTKYDYVNVNLRWAKVAAIAVLSDELIRFSSPSAEARVRDSLAKSVIARIDTDFINPAKAAVANVSPASITNGATTSASAGGTEAHARADAATLFNTYIGADMTPDTGVWIMTATTALQLSLMVNALGQPAFPGITMNGGTYAGLPVIVSQYVPHPTAGSLLILVNAGDIFLSDDGQVLIDASREASLEMLDNPTNNSATPTGTTMVSMFQTNSVAIRAERWINWARARPAAVAYLTAVNYDGT